jgi:zinc D-Ala-D-Ala carboxypeptidase
VPKKIILTIGLVVSVFILVAVMLIVRHDKILAPKTENNSNIQEPQTDQPQEDKPPTFNKSAYSLSDPTSIWVVSNKQRPLSPLNYVPSDLTNVGNGQRLRAEAASSLQTMMQAATKEGLALQPLSGYRSYATQQSVYAKEVASYGQAVADTESARPGYSEHQTGWAIDIGGGGCGIEDCFGNTAEGKWVAVNGYKYGFIIRYQPGKEEITGYRAEPWHIRYVGVELATEMQKSGQTLEEFFGLPAAPNY